MLKEFRDFIIRGNAIDLAIAIILGAAFGAVVTSLVDDVLMQIVAAIVGKPDFGNLTIPLGKSEIFIGRFLNAVISLVLVGFALFVVVKGVNRARRSKDEDVTPEDTVLLREIRDALAKR